ncbi:MAG: hypothetical protein LBL19_08675 [Spirochaetaceae bacterium]|jgi:drug/metabolite transporter (DMT)-like permease|nr:hypothetical protein [Spirochaetaceae bacterium]
MNIKKSPFRPLRLVLFVYDFFRLFFMLELLITVIPLGEAPEAAWFPYLVYAAPNALFPLMGLFLLSRPGEYKSYSSLYMAGKIIVIVSVLGWTIFSFQSILNSAFPAREFMTLLAFLFGLIILDAASLLANSLLSHKLNRNAAELPEETGEGGAVPEGSDGA